MSTLYPADNRPSADPTLASVLVAPGERFATLCLLLLTCAGFAALVGFELSGAVECPRTSQLELQFAWTQSRIDETLACWGEPGRQGVLRGLVADFVFIVGYVALLAMASMRLGAALERTCPPGWRSAGRSVALAALAAGLLDVVENLAIWSALRGATADPLGLAIGLLASVKFALVAVCVAFVVIACLRLRRTASSVGKPAGDIESKS